MDPPFPASIVWAYSGGLVVETVQQPVVVVRANPLALVVSPTPLHAFVVAFVNLLFHFVEVIHFVKTQKRPHAGPDHSYAHTSIVAGIKRHALVLSLACPQNSYIGVNGVNL